MTARRYQHTRAKTPNLERGDDWRDLSQCIGRYELFHVPNDAWTSHPEQEAEAKAVCATCPVRAQCLALAIEKGDQHGIFGGRTPAERSAIRRRATKEQTA